MGPEFWQTHMGKKLIEGDIPRLIKALESIAKTLGPQMVQTVSGDSSKVMQGAAEMFNTTLQRRAAEMMGQPPAGVVETMPGHGVYEVPGAISEELEDRARRVWRKLLPGETHTAKIRNALTAVTVLISDVDADEDESVIDARSAIEDTLDHLAAIDKERYELKLAISDLKNNIRILGSRVQEIEKLERETHRQLVAERAKYGDAFAVIDGNTFYCERCAKEKGIDLGAEDVQTWEVGSGGWLKPVVCTACKLSIPVVVNGEEGV